MSAQLCTQNALNLFPLILLLNRKSDKNLINSLCNMQLAAHKHTDICTVSLNGNSFQLILIEHLQQRLVGTSALAKLTLSLLIEGEFWVQLHVPTFNGIETSGEKLIGCGKRPIAWFGLARL
uniref:Uncharacterized protein n=1 Tax=Glossina palpalis gambiensis TaxID=67801 RepID=A0A1B0C0T8_9MUSC